MGIVRRPMSTPTAFALTLLIELSRVRDTETTLRVGLTEEEVAALRTTNVPFARILKAPTTAAYIRLCDPGFKHGVWLRRETTALPLYDLRRHPQMLPQTKMPEELRDMSSMKEYRGIPFGHLPETFESVDYQNTMFSPEVSIAPHGYPATTASEICEQNFARNNNNSLPRQATRAGWGLRITDRAERRADARAKYASEQAAYQTKKNRERAAEAAVATLTGEANDGS